MKRNARELKRTTISEDFPGYCQYFSPSWTNVDVPFYSPDNARDSKEQQPDSTRCEYRISPSWIPIVAWPVREGLRQKFSCRDNNKRNLLFSSPLPAPPLGTLLCSHRRHPASFYRRWSLTGPRISSVRRWIAAKRISYFLLHGDRVFLFVSSPLGEKVTRRTKGDAARACLKILRPVRPINNL